VTVYFAWKYRELLLTLLFSTGPMERSAFLTGAAVYSISFILGTNFNYRLIFLLFTVPHFFAMLRLGDSVPHRWARFLLLVLFCVFWLPWWHANPLTVPLESGLTWVLFAFFGSSCLAALYSVAPLGVRNQPAAV
jgi:hypothetical protein